MSVFQINIKESINQSINKDIPKLESDRRFTINFIRVEQPHLCGPEGELLLTVFTFNDPVTTL